MYHLLIEKKQMKINKDLVDAVMMLSFISLILAGTSDFSEATVKYATLAGLGLVVALMAALRWVATRREKAEPTYPDYES